MQLQLLAGLLRHGAVDDVGFNQGCDVELLLGGSLVEA